MMMRGAEGSLFSEHMQKTAFSLTVSVLGIVEEGSPPSPCHLLNHAVVKGGRRSFGSSPMTVLHLDFLLLDTLLLKIPQSCIVE
jgi:hypothetical protein